MPAMQVRISYLTAAGEEHEEVWPSVERFRSWAQAEGLNCSWRAYVADADGEWELVDEGEC